VTKDKHTNIYFDRDKLQFVGLSPEQILQLKDTFPSINFDFELKKMGIWLCSRKGKNRKGDLGFILHWLSNASPSYTTPTMEIFEEIESPIRPFLDLYLQDLWKGREELLLLNATQTI
jgi:hypothetical protein